MAALARAAASRAKFLTTTVDTIILCARKYDEKCARLLLRRDAGAVIITAQVQGRLRRKMLDELSGLGVKKRFRRFQ